MPTARRIEIPASGGCPSFHGDKHSDATDVAAAVTEDRRNNGDISDGTRGNDVSVTERRHMDHVQRESNGESKEHIVDRDEQVQCSKENANKLDYENVTQKQSQELLLQTNVSSLGQMSTQSVLRTRSSSQHEGPAPHTHVDDKNCDERTGMREVNFDLCPDNQNPQQQQSNGATHLASGQSTTTGQVLQKYRRPREPQPQQSQPEDELTRNYQLLAQQKILQCKNQTSSQTHQEECDSDLSQSTNRLSSKPNVSLQQNVHSESKQQQFRNGQENQEVFIESLQQNVQTLDSSFVRHQPQQEHRKLQQRSQPERQPQTHRDEVLMQKAQQNLQKINFPLDQPKRQQEHQRQQLSSLSNRLYPNGFLQHEVAHQEYQHHRETHQLDSNRNNSSEKAESHQHNYRREVSQLHPPSQHIPNLTTWQCTRCYHAHPSFIRSCPCVYGSRSRSDQTKITPHQHQGQQQQRSLHHQYNDRARSTASGFQPPTHHHTPLVQNTVRKPQWQHHQHLDQRQFNNREKSTSSDFEPLLVECHQKPMVTNNLPQTTFVGDLSNANLQSSLSNVNEPRHRTKKMAHRQYRHDFGSAVIDLTAGTEGESKNESKYFNPNNAHGPRPGNHASFSQRLNIQPIRQGETGSNQNDGGNDSDENRQSVNAHETTMSTHNATHRPKHPHDINANRTKRVPKSLTHAIENATSLEQLEGLRHHLKMMLEKVEDKINRALFDKAIDEFDSTNVFASANQLPSDDDMACDPNEIRLQRQACCPICFSFEDTSEISSPNSTKRSSSSCPICEEPNICQDCLSKCSVCQRVCCLDCMQTCDNCALHFCSDCPGYCTSDASGESSPKTVKSKRLCKKCVVNSMSGSWVKNGGARLGISTNDSSTSGLKRKRSNETSTQEKRAKTISSRAALTQYMPKQPAPTQKTSQLPGSISEASNDPTLQHANYAVCHKFIIQHEGKLGVHISADPKNPMCTIISRVEIGSPADIYGLKAGDQILHHDDNPNVKRTYKLTKDWLMNRLTRRPTSISVLRRCLGEGSVRHAIYALDSSGGKRPLHFEGDFCVSIHRFVFNDDRDLGMSIGEWPTGQGYSYTIVKNVKSGSLAETHGIRKGDIISKTTEDGRLLTGLSQWITTKIRGKPPFRFEILRLHKIENKQQPRDKIIEYQEVDCPKINVLPKESNESIHQNATSAAKEANIGQTVACNLSKDSKSEQTKVSESPVEPNIEEPISTETSQNSHISEGDSVRCSEDPMNYMIRNTDPSHLDDNRENPPHRSTAPGHEIDSNGSMPNSPHEKTKEILSVTNTNPLESFQTAVNNLVHKSNPTYKIGTKLWKKFLDDNGKRRPFEGTIESFDPNEGFYKIVYEDGDEEELTERQVSKLIQKNKKTTDENRPLLIGKLSLVKKDGKCLHSIRGYWHFENHPPVPSQTFELLRKDLSDEGFTTEKPQAANGEYYGSFVYEWKDPNSKEKLTAVIKESKVVIDFAKEGHEGESFLIKGKGINQYGIFELNGQASKDTKSNDSVYDIRMHKTYLKPDTVS